MNKWCKNRPLAVCVFSKIRGEASDKKQVSLHAPDHSRPLKTTHDRSRPFTTTHDRSRLLTIAHARPLDFVAFFSWFFPMHGFSNKRETARSLVYSSVIFTKDIQEAFSHTRFNYREQQVQWTRFWERFMSRLSSIHPGLSVCLVLRAVGDNFRCYHALPVCSLCCFTVRRVYILLRK